MSDRIEKYIELKASVSRVWRALTDYREFGEWFRVKMEGPFVEGREAGGQITHPGYEHVRWVAQVKTIEPERYFAFTWHPYGVEKGKDYSAEDPTLVEFFLEAKGAGCSLRIVESGFDKIPAYRRDEAFRMNDQGWSIQCENIAHHVAQSR